MNKRVIAKSLLPTLAITLGLNTSVNAADPVCTLETLKGSYTWDELTRTDTSWFPNLLGFTFEEHGSPIAHAVSVGHETNDGAGNITSGFMTINDTIADGDGTPEPFGGAARTRTGYTGTVTVEENCTGTYTITLTDGSPGGGGDIYIDPYTGNFKMLDTSNIGIARFTKNAPTGGLHSPFPVISWP